MKVFGKKKAVSRVFADKICCCLLTFGFCACVCVYVLAMQPKTKESLEKLRNSIALMEKREAFLQKKADDELKNAKAKLAAKNKKAAMAHLKRKKNYEAQIEKIQGSRLTLETQMVCLRCVEANIQSLSPLAGVVLFAVLLAFFVFGINFALSRR